MKLVVVTVGFEEKLPLRGLLKVGLGAGDVVMLVYSRTGGGFEVKKVERAVGVLKEIIESTGARVVEVEVSGTSFYDDVARMLCSLRELKAGEVVAVLAGGMRLIAFEVLFALLMLHRHGKRQCARCNVLLMREDGLYDITLPIESFYVTVPRTGLVVMRIINNHGEMKRSQLVKVASREAGSSESAVYKVIKDMVKKGLVAIESENVKLTEMGRLLYTLLGEQA
ncbi:MAG: hypothetical protein QXT64_01380 [Desulfurococcaceae archaeon]